MLLASVLHCIFCLVNVEPSMKSLITIFIPTTMVAYSQNEMSVWHFGEYAGLDFSYGFPSIALTNSAMDGFEGVAGICDNDASPLSYTNDNYVINKNHIKRSNCKDIRIRRTYFFYFTAKL